MPFTFPGCGNETFWFGSIALVELGDKPRPLPLPTIPARLPPRLLDPKRVPSPPMLLDPPIPDPDSVPPEIPLDRPALPLIEPIERLEFNNCGNCSGDMDDSIAIPPCNPPILCC